MTQILSKSQFKPRVLAYLRQVQETGEEIVLTDHGRPVLRIQPIREAASLEAIQDQWAERVADGRVRYDADEAVEPLPAADWGELGQSPE